MSQQETKQPLGIWGNEIWAMCLIWRALECCLRFVVVVSGMLFVYAGNSEQLHRRWKKKEGEEWPHVFVQLTKKERQHERCVPLLKTFDPLGLGFFNYVRKGGTRIILWGFLSIFLERSHRLLKEQEEGREDWALVALIRTRGVTLIIYTTPCSSLKPAL